MTLNEPGCPASVNVISYAAWLELFSAIALMAIAAWALLDPTVSHRVAGWVCAGLAALLPVARTRPTR